MNDHAQSVPECRQESRRALLRGPLRKQRHDVSQAQWSPRRTRVGWFFFSIHSTGLLDHLRAHCFSLAGLTCWETARQTPTAGHRGRWLRCRQSCPCTPLHTRKLQ